MAFPTGVSQRTWSATVSEPVTVPLLRQNVTDPLWLITSPPMAILAQQVTATSVPSTTVTSVGLDTEILDTQNGHSDAANTSRFYAAVAGWYLIKGCIPYAGSGGYGFTCSFNVYDVATSTKAGVDGGIGPGVSGVAVAPCGAELAVLSAPSSAVTSNDWCELYAYQNTGSAQNTYIQVSNGTFAWLMTRWVATPTGTASLGVPANPGYSDTTEITGAFLNSNIRDAVNFLSFPPMARLTQTSGQAVASASFPAATAVTFGSASAPGTSNSSDNYGGWSSSVNPSRYTFPVAGRYYCYGQVAYAANTSGSRAAGLRVNGGTAAWGARIAIPVTSSFHTTPVVEQHIRVNAGDYVELLASQDSGASNTLQTGVSASKLIVLWEGS